MWDKIIHGACLCAPDKYPDWVGSIVKRFRWKKLRFEFGNWCYQTDYTGAVLHRWWKWDNP